MEAPVNLYSIVLCTTSQVSVCPKFSISAAVCQS